MKAVFAGVALCYLSCAGAPVAAQPLLGEELAAYALDFCAVVLDGGSIAEAAAAANPSGSLIGPQAAGDDAAFFPGTHNVDRQTPIYVLGPPNQDHRVMAFVRADQRSCALFEAPSKDGGDRHAGALDALRARLGEDGAWQTGLKLGLTSSFERNARDGAGSLRLIAVTAGEGQVARVFVTREPGTIAIPTPEQRAAWAAHFVQHCGSAVHGHRKLAVEEMAPYFRRADNEAKSSFMQLEIIPGTSIGTAFANYSRGGTCLTTLYSGGVAELATALGEALVAAGAEAQAGGYRLPKPVGARGRDALFQIDSDAGIISVVPLG